MSAAQTTMDELLGHELACSRQHFELLQGDEALGLLAAHFRLLCSHGWDWRSALLLATAVETPAHEAGMLTRGCTAAAAAPVLH